MYSEEYHVGLDLDKIAILQDRTLSPPDPRIVVDLRSFMDRGIQVVIWTSHVDDEARTVRDTSKFLPDGITQDWYKRMYRDMIARLVITGWCIEHFGFVLPITNGSHPNMNTYPRQLAAVN